TRRGLSDGQRRNSHHRKTPTLTPTPTRQPDSTPRYTPDREEPVNYYVQDPAAHAQQSLAQMRTIKEKHLYAKAGAPDFRESVDAEIAALELGDAGLLQLDYQANCKVD
ncbi:hypothetical protein, partial [Propionibacterium freudenreichii]|uniref:hypothetical protein n=1 Tax=Propionibacterium freudenreichii TaxID=1744 RepID=UPI00254D7F69